MENEKSPSLKKIHLWKKLWIPVVQIQNFILGAVIKVMEKSKNSYHVYVVKVLSLMKMGPLNMIHRLAQPKMCSSCRFKGLITFDDAEWSYH